MNLERVQKYYELIDRELGLESVEDDLFGFESEEEDLFGFESDEDDSFGFEYADEDIKELGSKLIQNWYNKISSVWTEGFLITPHDVLNTQVTNDSFFDRMGNSLKKWFVCVAMLARKLLIYIKRKQFNNNDKPEDAKDLHETIKRLNITMASHIKTISILGNIDIWKGVKDNTSKVDNTITDDKLYDYNVI